MSRCLRHSGRSGRHFVAGQARELLDRVRQPQPGEPDTRPAAGWLAAGIGTPLQDGVLSRALMLPGGTAQWRRASIRSSSLSV